MGGDGKTNRNGRIKHRCVVTKFPLLIHGEKERASLLESSSSLLLLLLFAKLFSSVASHGCLRAVTESRDS